MSESLRKPHAGGAGSILSIQGQDRWGGGGAPACLGAEQDCKAHATVLVQDLPEAMAQIGLDGRFHGRIMG